MASWQAWSRMRSVRVGLVVPFAILVGAVFVGQAAAGGNYTVDDVAPLVSQSTTGCVYLQSAAINANGWVAGTTQAAPDYIERPFLYNGSLTFLASNGRGTGINSSGAVVGEAVFAGGRTHAFRYIGGVKTDLGALYNKGWSRAADVNDAGLIVGDASPALNGEHAFKYDTAMHDIGTLPGQAVSEARGVNGSGIIVGWSSVNFAIPRRAFRYSGTTMTDIGTLGGQNAEASDINDGGSIVGCSDVADGRLHAFLYDGTAMQDLTPQATSAKALGINNRGEVVGTADSRAFVYSDGRYVDLTSQVDPALGWTLTQAHDINDNGQIVGVGMHNGEQRIFRLSPTLLSRYAPELRYDVLDAFRADSPAELTDNFQPTYSNILQDATGTILALADPSLQGDDLSLDYLGSSYPLGGVAGGRSATSSDQIDATDTYDADAARMHALALYGHKMYGRAVLGPNGTTILQYWLFYYFNWHPSPTTVGDHEGDWEMIQIELDSGGNPVEAAYAQHETGETCLWSQVSKTTAGRPVVYVARGSHASYFYPGSKPPVGSSPYDVANGDSEEVFAPEIIDIGLSTPSWISWPGQWGGSDSSPVGPGFKGDQWDVPLTWSGALPSCWELGSGSQSIQSPIPAPNITLSRAEGSVRVVYSFDEWPAAASRRPSELIMSIRSLDGSSTQRVHHERIDEARGVIVLPSVNIPGVIEVAAAAHAGAGSSATVRVRAG